LSIVSSAIALDGRHVVERHTDHLGQQYMQSWFAPGDWTQGQIDALVSVHAAQLEAQLAESEAEQVIR
jgi:hypothetical protein